MQNGRGRWIALELLTALATTAIYFASCFTIRVKALDRVGQVSGIASLAFRFVVAAIVLVLVLVWAARWRKGAAFERVASLVCASAAGLVSGMIAGGILVALHATPYGLAAATGDSLVLSEWARAVQAGAPFPTLYPPLQVHLIAWLADLFHISTTYAMKPFQLLGLLLVGPLAYTSWRLLFRPFWALAIGMTISLTMIEAYRQYPFIVLIAFIPMAIRFLEILRDSASTHPFVLARTGVIYGLVFGVMFLTYSGWYQWSAPGFVVTAAIVFPWKTAPKHGAILCGAGAIAFLLVSVRYLIGIHHAPPIADTFMYFDSHVEPSYIAMWRGDLPGTLANTWPPVGELGGVGLFTVLLGVGFATAVALGRRTTAVISVAAIMAGAWLMRFWYAHSMWETGLVQLYPRTTAELLYCLLVLCGFAVYFLAERRNVTLAPSTVIGVMCGLLFIYEQAGSAIADRYMARPLDNDSGHLAYLALKTKRENQSQASDATAVVSSSAVPDTARLVNDDKPATVFSTAPSATPDHEEWIELHFSQPRTFSKIVLVPAADGFPVDYTIDVMGDTSFVTRVTRTGDHPPQGSVVLPLGRDDHTDVVRIHVTKLGQIAGGQYALRLGEFQIFR